MKAPIIQRRWTMNPRMTGTMWPLRIVHDAGRDERDQTEEAQQASAHEPSEGQWH
jgi:hypothetical protein